MNTIARSLAARLAFATERLRLRPLAAGDEPFYCRIYGDVEILRHVGMPLSMERARRSFAAALTHTWAHVPREIFAVLTCADGAEDLGICGLRAIDLQQRRAEAGILLSVPARGRGLAAEALRALLSRTFETLPVDEIAVEYSPYNGAMARLALRAGFTPAVAEGAICRSIRRRAAA